MYAAIVALACLWDYDTLKEEALGQGDVASVIGGDFHKHSTAFYEAKIEYTKKVIADPKTPKLDDRYDDLAVAYAKTGKFDEALATLDEKDKKFPGEYTTIANRGTVYAMKGDLDKAIEHLKKAIAANADAHFGREKYQVQLLEYLQRVAKDPSLRSKENFLGIAVGDPDAGHTDTIIKLETPAKRRKIDPATVAIAGLMRFGDGQASIDLWYGLAWALVRQGDAQLAVRAFRHAAVLGHPRAASDGAIVSTTIKSLDAGCCRPADDPRVQKAWGTMTVLADREFAAGQKLDANRQASEDKQLTKGQFKAVFGY